MKSTLIKSVLTKRLQPLIIVILTLIISGCINTGRYKMRNDQAPLRKPTTLETRDVIPKYEPIYSRSTKPYTVKNKRYVPLKSAKGFQEQGVASWYGRKFHGHLTANGEVYDMFAMTAAHKTLPIPSLVRVTNLDNKKSIIVRVNDRGPFHANRVIDLSYSAAYVLDVLNTGTANVSLEAIVVPEGQLYATITTNKTQPATPALTTVQKHTQQPIAEKQNAQPVVAKQINQAIEKQLFVQVLTSSNSDRISQTAVQLSDKLKQNSQIIVQNDTYKLRLGPLADKNKAQALISALKNNGYPNAYMLYTAPALTHN